VREFLPNITFSIESAKERTLKPVEQPEARIRVYFHLGIIGMILLIVAYSLNAGAYMGLPQGTWIVIFFLKFLSVILIGVAFLGYWRIYQSEIALFVTGYSILFTGITITALFLSFQFWLPTILTQPAFIIFIFSELYTLLALNLLIGFGLVIWGIAFRKIPINSKSHSIQKTTTTFFIIAGILTIAFGSWYFLPISVFSLGYFLPILQIVSIFGAAVLGILRFYHSLEPIESDFYFKRDFTLIGTIMRWSGITVCIMGILLAVFFYFTYYLSGVTGSPRYPWMTPENPLPLILSGVALLISLIGLILMGFSGVIRKKP